MPYYEFRCLVCGHHFEKILEEKDQEVRCLKCDASEVVVKPPDYRPFYPYSEGGCGSLGGFG